VVVAVLLSAPAAGMRLELEDPRPVLPPGAAVTVRWEGVPAAVHEVELLLELPGGAVRLTGSVGAAAGRLTLVVPAVAAPRARVRLRYGLGGHECLGPASRPFAIAAPTGGWALPGLAGGELWLGRGSRPLPPAGAGPLRPWLVAGADAGAVVAPPRWTAPRPAGTGAPPARSGAPAAPRPRAAPTRAPRDVPQRE